MICLKIYFCFLTFIFFSMKKIFTIVIFTLLAVGCSKDDSSSNSTVDINFITVTTREPENFTLSTAVSGGGSSVALAGYTFGVCYSAEPDPVLNISNNSSHNNAENATLYSSRLENLETGKTYYARAYLSNGVNTKYGNEISFVVPSPMTIQIGDICPTSFSADTTIGTQVTEEITDRGICYSNTPNPDRFNSVVDAYTGGIGAFTVSRDFLTPNTVYYVRPYVVSNNRYYYGTQVSLRTTGYIGGSGSYVFYDKGKVTDGWRYLEASPNSLTYSGQEWSCNLNFITGLSNDMGSGPSNTSAIRAQCNFTNVAATMCDTANINGETDWFLPSIEELKALYKLKQAGIFLNSSTLYSSSQFSNTRCLVMIFSNGVVTDAAKDSNIATVWPIRRY